MKKFTFFILFIMISLGIHAQVAESFNYQAVIRNSSGELIDNQNVGFRLSVLAGTSDGEPVYTETQTVLSNDYGICNLKVGQGTAVSGTIGDIDWSATSYFLKVEIDEEGGSDYSHIGTSELVSVPYAMYAKKTANAENAIFADYTDTANVAKKLDADVLYFTDSDTLFAVKDRTGNIVFAVFTDGVKVYVDESLKGNVGGFAVSGRGTGKGNVDYLTVTPDSTRIYVNEGIKGNVGGFAVSGRGTGKGASDYLMVTKDSTRIYIEQSAVKGSIGGFAVSGRGTGKTGEVVDDYFNISGNTSAEIIDPSQARILWYPKKEAFLTGRVLVEGPESVGFNSLATGFETKASGNYSQAMGYQSVASGAYSTAIGYQALANDSNSFGFGNYAQALGKNSFAFGENAVAYTSESYSFGKGAKSYGYRSFAFGSSGVDSSGNATGVTQAKGNYSFAIGQGSITGIDLEDCPQKPFKFLGTQEEYWKIYYSGEGAVAIGVGDSSLASYATSIGYYNTASYGSVALGYKNKAYGMQSAILGGYSNIINSFSSVIAGGYGHHIDDSYAAILGGIGNKVHAGAAWGVIGGGFRNEVIGSTSTVINGTYNIATGDLSTVTGTGNNARSWCETVIGQYNEFDPSGTSDEWIWTDPLFVIGNGTEEGARSNAMVVLKNGNIGIGENPGAYRLNVAGGDAYFSDNVSALSFTDRTPYPKDLETAYKAVLSMNRLPEGEYDENNKENQLDHSTLHPFVTSVDGEHRDLSATVSAQNEVIKDLVKQMEKLKDENELLKQKLNEIIELIKTE